MDVVGRGLGRQSALPHVSWFEQSHKVSGRQASLYGFSRSFFSAASFVLCVDMVEDETRSQDIKTSLI